MKVKHAINTDEMRMKDENEIGTDAAGAFLFFTFLLIFALILAKGRSGGSGVNNASTVRWQRIPRAFRDSTVRFTIMACGSRNTPMYPFAALLHAPQ